MNIEAQIKAAIGRLHASIDRRVDAALRITRPKPSGAAVWHGQWPTPGQWAMFAPARPDDGTPLGPPVDFGAKMAAQNKALAVASRFAFAARIEMAKRERIMALAKAIRMEREDRTARHLRVAG